MNGLLWLLKILWVVLLQAYSTQVNAFLISVYFRRIEHVRLKTDSNSSTKEIKY